MDTITQDALMRMIDGSAGGKGNVLDSKYLALVLKTAKGISPDAYEYTLGIALAKRRSILARDTEWQRKWGTTVSKRPSRGNHHDSWATRERYVRCYGDYGDYLPYAHSVLVNHPDWEVVHCRPMRKNRI
jgi:hypothetical protein